MSQALTHPAAGPMDRLAVVVRDPAVMDVIGQRVIDGESLKQIALSWQVPVMRFIEWVVDDPGRLAVYGAALKVRADELAHQVLDVADGRFESDGNVQRDALRVKARLQLASHWDRDRYGQQSRQDVQLTLHRAPTEMTDAELLAIIQRAGDAAKLVTGPDAGTQVIPGSDPTPPGPSNGEDVV